MRIRTVIGKVVGEVQSAYMERRNILDGLLIVNELCAWEKSTKKKFLLFKVDFDKAFDSINWEYLDSIMSQMGFGNKCRMWIRGCLSSTWASVLVNGSPTEEFFISKGVSQGNPLSPFLFIISMEGLNVALKSAVKKGIQIPGNGPLISHLFYMDDTLFFGWVRQKLTSKTLYVSSNASMCRQVLRSIFTNQKYLS